MAVLARFRPAHPGLTFGLTIGNSTVVLDQVLAYGADVASPARGKRIADACCHAGDDGKPLLHPAQRHDRRAADG